MSTMAWLRTVALQLYDVADLLLNPGPAFFRSDSPNARARQICAGYRYSARHFPAVVTELIEEVAA